MISQYGDDGLETRYDPRQMIRWPEMDTDALECWHGPLERWEGTVRIVQEHGCIFLDRNLASYHNELREEIISRKASAERMAEALRKAADGCDEVRGVRG